MREKVETHYMPAEDGIGFRNISKTKVQYTGTLIDFFLKLALLALILVTTFAVIQHMWTKEVYRQDYCAQGGIGDGGAYCSHKGGSGGS